jgi:hypothetical protein
MKVIIGTIFQFLLFTWFPLSILGQAYNTDLVLCPDDSVILGYEQGDWIFSIWQESGDNVDFLDIPGTENDTFYLVKDVTDSAFFRIRYTLAGDEPGYTIASRVVVKPRPLTPQDVNMQVLPGNEICQPDYLVLLQFNYKSRKMSGWWSIYKEGCGIGPSHSFSDTMLQYLILPDWGYNTYYLREEDAFGGGFKSFCEVSECTEINIIRKRNIEIQYEPDPVYEICEGEMIYLDLGVIGFEPQYQWQKDGEDIAEATENYLYWEHITRPDSGTYRCVISNDCSQAYTHNIRVIVKGAPSILREPSGDSLCPGEDHTFSITAHTGNVLSYQWWKGGIALEGENGPDLNLEDLRPEDSGSYYCGVRNECSGIFSDTAHLRVYPYPPEIDIGDDQVICAGEEIVLDAGTGFEQYLWNNQVSSSSIRVSSSGYYSVMAWDSNGCKQSSGSIYVEFAEPTKDDDICIVTIDMNTGHNLVVWEKQPYSGIVAYNIYRETTIGNYVNIGTVSSSELSIFEDLDVNPENQAYLYKITAVDTCNNETGLADSKYHKPIFLSWVSSIQGVNLKWTDYKIEGMANLGDFLTEYQILRGTDSSNLVFYKQLGSVNNYTDTDPATKQEKFYYRVIGILREPCMIGGRRKAAADDFFQTFSNIEDNKVNPDIPGSSNPSVMKDPILVFPNPFSDYTTIRFNNPDHKKYRLVLYDPAGRIVMVRDGIRESELHIYRNELAQGCYRLVLMGDTYYQSTLVLQ